MTQLRLAFSLMTLLFAGNLQSAPIYAPEAEVMDRLAAVYATRDPARLAMAFRAMGDYGRPAANIVESSINAMGYRHLDNNEIDAAIAVFELNVETFPESANAWDSLGEAVMAGGDHDMAIRRYRRSLELDSENKNAARMIEQISQQVSHVSGM